MNLHLSARLVDRLGLTPIDGKVTGAQVLDAVTTALVAKPSAPAAADVPAEIAAFRAQIELYDAMYPVVGPSAHEVAARYTAAENDAYYALFPEERP